MWLVPIIPIFSSRTAGERKLSRWEGAAHLESGLFVFVTSLEAHWLNRSFDAYFSNTHTTVLLLFWNMSGTTRVSRYQKGKTRQVKTNLDLLEQEIVSGSGICWAICKVCTSSQTITPTSHHSVFYRLDALPAAQPTASKH